MHSQCHILCRYCVKHKEKAADLELFWCLLCEAKLHTSKRKRTPPLSWMVLLFVHLESGSNALFSVGEHFAQWYMLGSMKMMRQFQKDYSIILMEVYKETS